MNKISDMREHYDRATLDETCAHPDAMRQFHIWFEEAREDGVVEPNAMILSTVNKEGNPASRTLLLKGLEEDRLLFYTNYKSDKAKEIEMNPNVSICFLWKELQRQVRITGKALKISKDKSEAYFHSRPKGSQIGAWVSPQSEVIPDKEFITKRKTELVEKYKDVDVVPLPDFWGGYYIKPKSIEFWQGRPDRLHDRLLYTQNGEKWKIQRLAP